MVLLLQLRSHQVTKTLSPLTSRWRTRLPGEASEASEAIKGNAERWALKSGVDLITSLPKKGGQIKIIHIYIYTYIYIYGHAFWTKHGGLHYSIPNILAANLNKSSQCYPWHGEMVHIAPPNQGSQTGSRAKWLNTVNGGHLSANLQVP